MHFIRSLAAYTIRSLVSCQRWRSWFRHWATSRKVAGSIPDGIIGIFHWHNPSGRTMALGLTQPLTEMSTRNLSWAIKAAGAYGWQPYHLHVPTVMKPGNVSLLEPSGPVQACTGIALPFTSVQVQVFSALCSLTCWIPVLPTQYDFVF